MKGMRPLNTITFLAAVDRLADFEAFQLDLSNGLVVTARPADPTADESGAANLSVAPDGVGGRLRAAEHLPQDFRPEIPPVGVRRVDQRQLVAPGGRP